MSPAGFCLEVLGGLKFSYSKAVGSSGFFLEWKNHPTAAGRSVGPQLHPRCCRDTRFAMLPCWRLGQLYGKKKTSEGINGMEINDEIQSFSELCLALFEIRTFLKAG